MKRKEPSPYGAYSSHLDLGNDEPKVLTMVNLLTPYRDVMETILSVDIALNAVGVLDGATPQLSITTTSKTIYPEKVMVETTQVINHEPLNKLHSNNSHNNSTVSNPSTSVLVRDLPVQPISPPPPGKERETNNYSNPRPKISSSVSHRDLEPWASDIRVQLIDNHFLSSDQLLLPGRTGTNIVIKHHESTQSQPTLLFTPKPSINALETSFYEAH